MPRSLLATLCLWTALLTSARADEPDARPSAGLLAHWPLRQDARDVSGNQRHAVNHGVEFHARGAKDGTPCAHFSGRGAWLELPAERMPRLGAGDFSIAAWLHTDEQLSDVPGDLISQYDSAKRRGFHLTLKNNAGVTSNQANVRQLQFGIDNDRAEKSWTDHGRPGQAVLGFAVAVHDGSLYVGTCEPGENESGHVYRFAGGAKWIDCGAPDESNSVTALAVHDGKLYAGTGKYRLGGSALPESKNTRLGGRIFRYEGGTRWTPCGQLPEVEAVGGLVTYAGRLYATSLYKPAGFFRYEGAARWTSLDTPGGKRVVSLAAHDGALYAGSYDGGHVYRYDGRRWSDLGQLAKNTQTYSFVPYHGRLHVGTWPSGEVFRLGRLTETGAWEAIGRLGEELEVMGMIVHNGRLLAGTLPLAQVWQHEGGTKWSLSARLDHTPDVRYRRVWTMAEYQGRLFATTLPSGHVYSHTVGVLTTHDRELSAGWHHVAAIRSGGQLKLLVDGKAVANSPKFSPADYDLTSTAPWKIGSGANDFLCGCLADLRVYGKALSEVEVARLAARRP
jgi:hypothetical protein